MQEEGFEKSFLELREQFNSLYDIVYKDICINHTQLRILGIHFMNVGPEWKVKKHMHSFFEFHYVIEGSVYTTINNVEYKISQGNFYIMPPGLLHSHRHDAGGSHTGFALRWEFIDNDKGIEKSGYITSEFDKISKILLYAHSRPVKDDGSVLDSMMEILKAAQKGCSVLELQILFCRIIIAISKKYTQDMLKTEREFDSAFLENQIVDNVIRIIDESCCKDINVKDISNAVHLSYSYLSRLFKKHTGMTINKYLNEIRLRKAQKLILCSNKSIAQIAAETGFSSEHYFCSQFKKFFGISPGKFRSSGGYLME